MKLTLKHYETTYSIEQPKEDLTLEEVMEQMVRPVIKSMGYPEECFNEWWEAGNDE